MHKLVLMVLALTWIIGISVKERNSNDDDSSGDVPQPKSLNDVAGQNGKGKPSHPSFKLNNGPNYGGSNELRARKQP